MTTIAYRRYPEWIEVAADRQCTHGSRTYFHDKFKVFGSSLILVSGNSSDLDSVYKWLAGGAKRGDLDSRGSSAGFIVAGDRVQWIATEEGYLHDNPHEFNAMGSGGDFAVGAMAAGLSAKDAVALVIKQRLDIHTGGEIDHFRVYKDRVVKMGD